MHQSQIFPTSLTRNHAPGLLARMYMLPLLLVAVLSLLPSPAGAQTKDIDLDNERFSYAYRGFPSSPQSPMDFKYAVSVTASPAARDNIALADVVDAIFIEGQDRAEEPEDADMHIGLDIGSIIIKKNFISDNNGKEEPARTVDDNTKYQLVLVYTFDVSYTIRGVSGKVARRSLYTANTDEFKYTSDKYKSHRAAVNFWRDNREVLLAGFYKDLTFKAARTLSDNLSGWYGFPALRDSSMLKNMDEKKHKENMPFRAAVSRLKAYLQAMTPNQGLDKETVEPLIEYFKSIPEKYTDPTRKADIKLRYAAWYNLCRIYLFLDEPEEVAPYADKIYANGQDKKDGEKLKKEADALMAAFRKYHVHTRHFEDFRLVSGSD